MQEMQETQVHSPGQEVPLEEEMTTHSSILAWRIPWTVEPGGQQSIGSQRVRHDWAYTHTRLDAWQCASYFKYILFNLYNVQGDIVNLSIWWIRNLRFYFKLLVEGFPGGSVVKNPPAEQKTQVHSLGWEDPLEKEMANYSGILAWEIPSTENVALVGYSSWNHKRVRHDLMTRQPPQQRRLNS